MTSFLIAYSAFVSIFRTAVFYVALVLGLVVLMDWAVRTRRISPFTGTARFFRKTVDPWMVPVERMVVRAGGQPASAPWWSLVAVVAGGVVLLFLLDVLRGLLAQLALGVGDPRILPIILLSWAFRLVEFALIVRVLSSWLPISPYSRWIRWTYPLTNWILVPLRRFIPTLGMVDITPVVAYLILAWLLEPTVIRIVRGLLGV